MWLRTSGSKSQVPALPRLLGAWPGGGFSTKRVIRLSGSIAGDAVGRGVGDRREEDAHDRVAFAVLRRHRRQVDVGQHVAVADEEGAVEVARRLLHGEAGAQRLGLVAVGHRTP